MTMKHNPTDVSLFEIWLRNTRALAESSIYTYVKSLEKFLSGSPDLELLDDYNNFLVKMTRKKRCSHFYSVIKSFIEFKITDSNLRQRLIPNLMKPEIRTDFVRERRHLDEGTILEVLNYMERKKHTILALIQNITGARIGDVLRLKEG